MATTSVLYTAPYLSESHTSFGREVLGLEAAPDQYTFLSFLATAQALDIEILPITWEAASQRIGLGGTSKVNESSINADTSFAFKRVRDDGKEKGKEKDIFRNIINEITVLAQPPVRGHPNIVELQGICWDISADDKPWPVLVFEKSEFGDLHNFMETPVGRQMDITERLKLCAEIGTAIISMHSNKIVHGDIKPQNVLIFREKNGEYHAQVIDFGYSTLYADDDHRIKLPRSKPWNAPEHNRRAREWTPLEAIRTDLFSFGMLCLWLLFEPYFLEVISLSRDLEGVGSSRSAVQIIGEMKGKLQEYAQLLLALETALGHENQIVLKEFFESSLSREPEKRETSLSRLLTKLDPRWTNLQKAIWNSPQLSIKTSDFKIENSVYALYRSDYRIRSYIAQCLLDKKSQSASIDIQAALCHYIGFGVLRDEAKATEILDQSKQNIQAIQKIVSSLSSEPDRFQPAMLSRIEHTGSIPWSDFTNTYIDHGRLDKALEQIMQDLYNLTVTCGENHLLTDLSRDMLAKIYHTQGRWDAAEELQVQVMNIRKENLGADHLDTLRSMTNLALTYGDLGRWEAAEELQVQVMNIRKENLDADYLSTLTSMSNLAVIYSNQGRWEAAEELQVQEINIYKEKLGADYPSTLTSISNLALTYSEQGRWEAAEELQVQVMNIRKKKLGANYPSTLTSMSNLASTYSEQGRWEAAEELQVQVMIIRKEKLGADHPFTLTSMSNLAVIYSDQGRWEAAEELQVQVVNKYKEKLGADHPSTLTSMSNLASTYSEQGRWEAAEELQVQVMIICKEKLGANYPSMLTSISNLALTYSDQGRWEAAEELQVQEINICKEKLDADYLSTLTSINNLALIYSGQGRWEATEELQVQVMIIYKEKLGADYPSTLTSISNLALTYSKLGRWEAAEELQVQVTNIRKEKLGTDHPSTLTSINNLALTYSEQGRWEAAEELQVQVTNIRKEKLGTDHPDTLTSMNNLAFIWKRAGRETEAIRLMEECIQSRKRVMGHDHSDTLSSCSTLAAWMAGQEDAVMSV